jgi:serine/threonine protein phosphatase PrpC
MPFQTHVLSRPGRRPSNEDAAGTAGSASGPACWVLADGLGGHRGGGEAARAAVDHVEGAFAARPEVSADRLRDLVDGAHAAVRTRQAAEPDLDAMRTTLVVLLADAGRAAWAHVGDSRLYFFRQGRLARQTHDHSVPGSLVAAGALDPADVRGHPDRNGLLRSLGQAEPVGAEVLDPPVAVAPGDAFLLCSDGFWEPVREAEMEAELAKAASPAAWLAGLEDRLLARLEPDHDNYTAVAVHV